METIDLTGQVFGYWTVESKSDIKNRRRHWNCVCKCGTRKRVPGSALRKGSSKSCGCRPLPNFIDLTGKVFGYWQVVDYAGSRKWNCVCKCGTERAVSSRLLIKAESKSCGCRPRGGTDEHSH